MELFERMVDHGFEAEIVLPRESCGKHLVAHVFAVILQILLIVVALNKIHNKIRHILIRKNHVAVFAEDIHACLLLIFYSLDISRLMVILVMKITKNYVDRRILKKDVKPILSYDPEIQKEAEENLDQQ